MNVAGRSQVHARFNRNIVWVACRTEFDGYDEDETVKVVFLGNQAPVKCELTKAAMECDQSELEGRIQEAMKDAHEKCVECYSCFDHDGATPSCPDSIGHRIRTIFPTEKRIALFQSAVLFL